MQLLGKEGTFVECILYFIHKSYSSLRFLDSLFHFENCCVVYTLENDCPSLGLQSLLPSFFVYRLSFFLSCSPSFSLHE